MEDGQQAPPEIAELQERADKFPKAFNKLEHISATIGTPDFQGHEKYIPPTPDQPNYLKESIKVALTSSRVKRAIEERSLPRLENIYNSLQEEIAHRQELLSDAAEYQMNLHELRELQNEGYLTNPSVIDMVEEALKKIDEELHRTPSSSPITQDAQQGDQKTHTPRAQVNTVAEHQEQTFQDPDALRPDGIEKLNAIIENMNMTSFEEIINRGRRVPLFRDKAATMLNGILTKLYHRVNDGRANEAELELWQNIADLSDKALLSDIRSDFHREIDRYVAQGPRVEKTAETPRRPQRIRKESGEKKPVDPHEIVRGVLERITNHGIKVGTNQRFNPLQVVEIFGANRTRDRLALERGIVTPEKRKGNDYHPSYDITEAIQMAVIPKYLGATKEQLEELPTLIQLEIEQWIKDHPDTISSK